MLDAVSDWRGIDRIDDSKINEPPVRALTEWDRCGASTQRNRVAFHEMVAKSAPALGGNPA